MVERTAVEGLRGVSQSNIAPKHFSSASPPSKFKSPNSLGIDITTNSHECSSNINVLLRKWNVKRRRATKRTCRSQKLSPEHVGCPLLAMRANRGINRTSYDRVRCSGCREAEVVAILPVRRG